MLKICPEHLHILICYVAVHCEKCIHLDGCHKILGFIESDLSALKNTVFHR